MTLVSLSRLCTAGWIAVTVAALASPAAAQEEAAAHTEAVALGAAPAEDHTLFQAMLGLTGNSGNTKSVAGNAGFSFLLKRKQKHAFTLEGLGTMGYANTDTYDDMGNVDGTSFEQNTANFVGRARYDYFLTDKDALFVAVVPRRDTYAGIGARIQVQAGYARVLYQGSETHKLWSEVGGDATIDRYVPIDVDGVPNDPEDTEIYSVRMFLGYSNHNNSAAELDLGVEALVPPYNKTGEDGSYRYRINGTAQLNSSLNSRFKLGLSIRTFFDSSPPIGTPSRIDTISAFQLTYTYDSIAEKPPEPEAPACPPCEAAPEAAAAGSEYEAAKEANEEATAPAVEAPEVDEAAAEATAPAEQAAEAGEAAPPPPGTSEAPIEPPAPAAAQE